MNSYKTEYCMKRMCKNCERKYECDLLDFVGTWRMTYKPFECLKDHKLCRKYKEMKEMKKIRANATFKDIQHGGLIRRIGDVFVEDSKRADELIKRGYASLVEEIVEKKVEVEQAVKEVKKEKAIKEKAVKEVKKNAKK